MNSNRKHIEVIATLLLTTLFSASAIPISEAAKKPKSAGRTSNAISNTILNGKGAPLSTLGINGDFYIDTRSLLIYGPKKSNKWPLPQSLQGPAGTNGADGKNGSEGKTISNASSVAGPTGSQGEKGEKGDKGESGSAGAPGAAGLTGAKGEIAGEDVFIPFGKARIAAEGSDVLIVTYGYSVEVASKAAEIMKTEGVSVEVMDLRTVYPIDYEMVLQRAQDIGRVIVADEAPLFGSITGEIASTISEKLHSSLKAPVLRIGAKRVPIGANPQLVSASIPNVEDYQAAIRKVLTF